MKAASSKFNAARKAYQLDRVRFTAERSSEVAVAFRKAKKELEDATRKAILAGDPSLASLLDKAQAGLVIFVAMIRPPAFLRGGYLPVRQHR